MSTGASDAPQRSPFAWHALTVDEALSQLDSDGQQGLSPAEIARRLERYGRNKLPEGRRQGPWMRFLLQLHNVLVYVLLAAGFVKLMAGLWLDAAIILGVVVINALLGFIQEGKAEKALESIRNMLSAEARTLRGGETRMVPTEELVPGDIVLLESGDRIPADLRLVDVKSLRTEEAALTGESVPIDKTTDAVSEKATVGDREGMAFSGTLVSSGRGTGVVVATGADTELGRINQMMAAVSVLETPLLRQIKSFGYKNTAVIAVVSVIVFAFGRWVREMPFVDIFWLEVSDKEQKRRFEARITDPLRQWKLSPTDLCSRSRWFEYSRARDIMLEATDTAYAPWHIVPSDDKRRARLNCISHLLTLIPYDKLRRRKVKLPGRSMKDAYDDRAPLEGRRFVEARY